ncbi:MAG: GNAT family N-acetyltransferase [Promethearchaeota archaeon]
MSEKKVTVRWYKAGDYKKVEDLVRALAGLFGDPFEKHWFEIYMGKRLMEPVPGCFVAVDDGTGEVVGSIFCDILRDPTGSQYGYISNIMVEENYRGKGVGKSLLNAAIKYLTMTGVPRIWANVREEDAALVHLFGNSGFKKKFTTFEMETPPFGL